MYVTTIIKHSKDTDVKEREKEKNYGRGWEETVPKGKGAGNDVILFQLKHLRKKSFFLLQKMPNMY